MKGSGILEWALAATAAIRRAVDSLPTCATGVHMIVARGTGENTPLGKMGRVVENVTLAIPGSDYTAVVYPATFLDYQGSMPKGANEFHRLIKEHTEACPDSKLVLMGFSQGAHAMMDAVCGSEQAGPWRVDELGDDFKSNIVAVIAMGDPSHNPSAPWNKGTSQNQGLFSRTDIEKCEPYTPMIRGYCDTGDVWCDKGDDQRVHGSYFNKYTEDAVEFIVQKFLAANESSAGDGAPSVVPSSTAGPTTLSTVAPEPSNAPGPSTTSVPASGSLVGPSALILMAGFALSLVTLA
ncbi:Cutinase domain containing protein [Rhypophila decipiens]